jgi:beta-lactamase regulating signal transducer with metallopeptidase domain
MGYLFIFLQYFLQVLGHSCIYLAAAFIVLHIFRIKDSQIRIFVFLLALIKPLFVLTRLIDFSSQSLYSQYSYFYIINKLIGGLLNIQSMQKVDFFIINSLILGFYSLTFFIITISRYYQTYFYFYRLKKTRMIIEVQNGWIKDTINYHARQMGLKTPEVYYSTDLKNRFYTFGFIRKKIIINKVILDFLTEEEKETIFLHELSHIKRNDYILNTIITYLTDMHFFNPFAYIAYLVIKTEQEKDCDNLVMRYTHKSGKEVAINILSSILKIKKNSSYLPDKCPELASSFSIAKPMSEISINKRIKHLIDTSPTKISASIYTKILIYSFFLILLFF